ncbi:hypothetical protein [Coleofasciculus sp.]|uniref:hypothetical protein n=1 Tax=Coleofasciculus sp. TaxID=3100458 RepID=UPI0039FB09E5
MDNDLSLKEYGCNRKDNSETRPYRGVMARLYTHVAPHTVKISYLDRMALPVLSSKK